MVSIKTLTGKELQQDSVTICKKHWSIEDKKFYNKNGFLTSYGYVCGYMDTFKLNGFDLSLELDGIWQVKLYHPEKLRVLWECFDDTTAKADAQKFFLRIRKMIKNDANIDTLSEEAGYADRLYISRHKLITRNN